jgi:hypothetical protein
VQDKAAELAEVFNNRLESLHTNHKHEGSPSNFTCVSMLPSEIFRLKDDKARGGFRYIGAEPYLKGEYVKYNGNNGYVCALNHSQTSKSGDEGGGMESPETLLAAWKQWMRLPEQVRQCLVPQAFTHWSFECTTAETDETIMVCDIQGVGYRYTGPTIISLSKRFGKADLGVQGISLCT